MIDSCHRMELVVHCFGRPYRECSATAQSEPIVPTDCPLTKGMPSRHPVASNGTVRDPLSNDATFVERLRSRLIYPLLRRTSTKVGGSTSTKVGGSTSDGAIATLKELTFDAFLPVYLCPITLACHIGSNICGLGVTFNYDSRFPDANAVGTLPYAVGKSSTLLRRREIIDSLVEADLIVFDRTGVESSRPPNCGEAVKPNDEVTSKTDTAAEDDTTTFPDPTTGAHTETIATATISPSLLDSTKPGCPIVVRCLSAFVQCTLLPVVEYLLWLDEPIYSNVTHRAYFGALPYLYAVQYCCRRRDEARRSCESSGLCNSSKVFTRLKEIVNVLSGVLGSNNFIKGKTPGMIDAVAFSYLSVVFSLPLQLDKAFEKSSKDGTLIPNNLVEYCQRLNDVCRIWPRSNRFLMAQGTGPKSISEQ